MMETTKKKKPLIKFIFFLFLILIVISMFYAGFKITNYYFPSQDNTIKDNTTIIIENQSITNITNVLPEQPSIWNALTIIIIAILVIGLLGFCALLLFKYLNKARPFTVGNRKTCMKKAYEELIRQGYKIGYEIAKQSYPYFGTDEEKHPVWIFIFVKNREEFETHLNIVPKEHLISCKIKARTYEVFDEAEGLDMDDIKKGAWEQRFGKNGVPNFPGKTERKPSVADLFVDNKSNVTMSVDPSMMEDDE